MILQNQDTKSDIFNHPFFILTQYTINGMSILLVCVEINHRIAAGTDGSTFFSNPSVDSSGLSHSSCV